MNMIVIKHKIIDSGLTINDIAKIIDLNPQTITNWINKRNLSQIDKFLQLLILLDIDIKDLY